MALLVALAPACDTAQAGTTPPGLLAELAREMRGPHPLAPRLSVSPARQDCPLRREIAARLLREPCAAPAPPAARPSRQVARIAARAARAIRQEAHPDAMHAAALIDLLHHSGSAAAQQRAISSLQNAARLSRQPAPVLADLSAAYLVRHGHGGSPRDLLAALEAAEQAVRHDPGNEAARFNGALALLRFGLVEEAAHDWRAYLRRDSTSSWAARARGYLRESLAARAPAPQPEPDAPVEAFASYAAADPQGARTAGWCGTLGAWAGSLLHGRAGEAEDHLRRAEAMGAALEARPGGDATLADAVRAVRSRRGAPLAELARAHRNFAEGCGLAQRGEFSAASPRLAAAASGAGGSPTLYAWARLLYGGTAFHSGDPRRGKAIVTEVVRGADTLRHAALAGHARQLLAVIYLRAEQHEPVLEQAERGAALFARAGETANVGVMLDAQSNASFFLGETDRGYLLAHRALRRLLPYRDSYRLHNLLSYTAEIVADDGFRLAAVRMQDEGVRVAERTGTATYVAEARLTRARLRGGMDTDWQVENDVAIGRAATGAVNDPDVRAYLTAQLQMARAPALLRSRPAAAAGGLDSAAAFFLEGMDAPLLAFPAVVQGARARAAAGQPAEASRHLVAALALLERRRDHIRMEPRRAAVFEDARALVDQATLLELAAGRQAGALAYLDRGRASLATVGAARPGAAGGVAGPPGEVALVYALMADTLLAWTVAGNRVELFRSAVDTVALVRTVEALRARMEDMAGPDELRPGLARLHEWLVRPLAGRLGAPGTPLVIIADGELGSVPFAALLDARTRRYLVQDHPLRFAASLREARRPARPPSGRGAAVFVADPAFDAGAHPGYPRLAGAAGEAREIAAAYPGAQVLSGTQAHGSALRRALRGAALVHYAGHAVFDDARPERSRLLLAPTPGQAASGPLEAGDIAQMDLRHVSLVVLSACHTVRTGRGRAAGFSGLAGAFLAAGAGGAVGSLWEVDDVFTRPLMVEFHRAYRTSGNGPRALREAQLQLLRSADPAVRSPAVWASFRYAGG